MKLPQVVATTLTLAFLVARGEAQLLKHLASEECSAHRHMASDFTYVAFTQIVSRQGGVDWSPTEFVHQRRNAPRFQDNVVVQKHYPRGSTAQPAFVPCPRNRIPAAPIFRVGRTNHAMYDEVNLALITKSALHLGMQRPDVPRQYHQIDFRSHKIRRFRLTPIPLSSQTRWLPMQNLTAAGIATGL
jgi:hypothetical protein